MQFRLKWLIIACTLAPFLLSLVFRQAKPSQNEIELRAIDHLKARRCFVSYPNTTRSLKPLLGYRYHPAEYDGDLQPRNDFSSNTTLDLKYGVEWLNYADVDSPGFWTALTQLTKLEALFPGGSISDEHMPLLSAFPELKVLSLRYTPVTEDGIKLISSCRKLEYLDISSQPLTRDLADAIVSNFPRLLSLSCYQAPDDPAGLLALRKLTNLRYLTVSTCSPTRDNDPKLVFLLENMPALRELHLLDEGCADYRVENNSLLEFVVFSEHDREQPHGLNDDHPPVPRDPICAQLTITSCPNLRKIELVRDIELKLEKLEGMEEVFFHRIKISSTLVNELTKIPSLTYLKFTNSRAYESGALDSLKSNKNLRTMFLVEMHGLDDDDANVIRTLSKLEDIYLSGADVTDRIFDSLSELSNLKNVVIHRCPVSRQAAELFQSSHPNIQLKYEPLKNEVR